MTIADAFNEIAAAQGGEPNYSGTIAAAIDAVNDALAGSDQPSAQTIEGAVRLLGQHIGGSVSGTIEITENGEGVDVAQYAYADVNVSGGGSFGPLQFVVLEYDLPTVGNMRSGAPQIFSLDGGGTVFAQGIGSIFTPIAAGLTAVSYSEAQYTECDAYVCGTVLNEYDEPVYTSVTPWEGTVTVGSMEQVGETFATYTLTVPELDFDPETMTGECLVLYVHEA